MAANQHTVEIKAVANTDRLVRKLRAISQHTAALADELEAIDAEPAADAATTWCACPTVTGGRVDHHEQCHLHGRAA
jgi:hypothetical protein